MPPRAKNAVFEEAFKDRRSSVEILKFLKYERDEKPPDAESGYVSFITGDSGSSYCIIKIVH